MNYKCLKIIIRKKGDSFAEVTLDNIPDFSLNISIPDGDDDGGGTDQDKQFMRNTYLKNETKTSFFKTSQKKKSQEELKPHFVFERMTIIRSTGTGIRFSFGFLSTYPPDFCRMPKVVSFAYLGTGNDFLNDFNLYVMSFNSTYDKTRQKYLIKLICIPCIFKDLVIKKIRAISSQHCFNTLSKLECEDFDSGEGEEYRDMYNLSFSYYNFYSVCKRGCSSTLDDYIPSLKDFSIRPFSDVKYSLYKIEKNPPYLLDSISALDYVNSVNASFYKKSFDYGISNGPDSMKKRFKSRNFSRRVPLFRFANARNTSKGSGMAKAVSTTDVEHGLYNLILTDKKLSGGDSACMILQKILDETFASNSPSASGKKIAPAPSAPKQNVEDVYNLWRSETFGTNSYQETDQKSIDKKRKELKDKIKTSTNMSSISGQASKDIVFFDHIPYPGGLSKEVVGTVDETNNKVFFELFLRSLELNRILMLRFDGIIYSNLVEGSSGDKSIIPITTTTFTFINRRNPESGVIKDVFFDAKYYCNFDNSSEFNVDNEL